MIKILTPDTHDALVAVGIPLSSLVCDRGPVKSASEAFMRDKIAMFRPDDRHFMQHVIAMGAHERYGWNRNGDTFTREELIKHHPTFEKHAHMFREHRNYDPSLAIGSVKAAAYNPKMDWVELLLWGDKRKAEEEYELAKSGSELSYSMSCFVAGTMVRMGDGSRKPIESLRPGDKVLTHKGRVQEVSHTMSREYSGRAVRLFANGLPGYTLCTEDHGIWARRKASHIHECPVCGGVFKSLRAHMRQQTDGKHRAALKDVERYAEGFTAAGNLRPGDMVRQAVDHRVVSGGSRDLAVVLGYYLAEGSLSVVSQKYVSRGTGEAKSCPDHRTEFTFHIDEKNLVAELQDSVEALGYPRPSSFDYPGENRTVVRSHSKELHDWLLHHGGKYSHGKRLSQEVMLWSPEFQKIVFEKWTDGDGHFHKEFSGQVITTTTSSDIAWQMTEIAARCGIAAMLWTSPKDGHRKRGRKRAYTVTTPRQSVRELCLSKVQAPVADKERKLVSTAHLRHHAVSAQALHMQAKATAFVENGFVYRRLRKIKHEIIAAPVYDITVPGDHGFLANGIGVSNCKVPGDVCSCCQKFSRRTTDYCDHAANNLGRYLPEFRKYAFVFNPSPKFFDISRVGKPADRIAHYISYEFPEEQRKAASAGDLVISGADWAKHYKLSDDTSAIPMLEKFAGLRDDMFKLAAATGMNGFDGGIDLDDQAIAKLRTRRLGTVFHAMAKRACILPFRSFVALLTGQPVGTFATDEFKAAAAKLRDNQLKEACCAMADIAPDFEAAPCGEDADPIDDILDNADPKFECAIERARPASQIIVIKASSAEADAWAAAYDVYRAVAVNDMLDYGTIEQRDVASAALRF